MTYQQKLFFFMSFLYPYPEDAAVLPLPKSLHFLYLPYVPCYGHGGKQEACVVIRGSRNEKYLVFHKEIRSFAGRILYFNFIGMVLISLFEGVGIFLLVPLISLSGIVDVQLEEDCPISGSIVFFKESLKM